MSITHFKILYRLPVIIRTTMIDIRQQVREEQKKQGRGIDIDSNDINIIDINDFIQFKTLEYKVYNFKDNKL